MAATAPSWSLDKVGEWGETSAFEVERERIVAYAEATNDDFPAHRSGDLAPPVFAVVPAFQSFAAAVGAVVPPEILMTVVHGEQDFFYHRPVVPGEVLETRSAVVGAHARSSGATAIVKVETRASGGDLAVEQYMTAFFRGAELAESVGEVAPGHSVEHTEDPLAFVEQRFDSDQTHRYAAASGDPMPIHTDDAFAKSVGLPGIIVHGLCTMAFCSRAVIENGCADDPTRLRRLAVRFAGIVQPHEQIATTLWRADDGRLAFETSTDSGNLAIKDGLAEIA
ncbi:MAG: MaoC family dehydratase N-terminal domain-containing protein [Thermoleophilaceae bacterium]|nr:MaoC family dehydratase N-terminal domain-containing protein [Thermoleophilaceae bacterium]